MPAVSRIDRILAAREGGHVERCHTFPHHGTYSVASHSYNMVAMLVILHPEPSLELIKACLLHDCAERWVGDVPSPAKPHVAPGLGDEEDEILRHFDFPPKSDLSEEDARWVSALDALEFLIWCSDQIALGNQRAEKKYRAQLLNLQAMKLPAEVSGVMFAFLDSRMDDDYPWQRRMTKR